MNKDRLAKISRIISRSTKPYGVISFGHWGDSSCHMTVEKFLEEFDDFETVDFDNQYWELRKKYKGVDFYALKEKRKDER